MKKIFIFILTVSLLSGIEQNVMGQYCNSNGDPANVTVTPNLLIAKPHYFYFGQVWYTDIVINKQALKDAVQAKTGINIDNIFTIKYAFYHGNFGGFNEVTPSTSGVSIYTAISNQLINGGASWNTNNGDKRFWFSRMSANAGQIGKYFLIGVKVNNDIYWGKVLWKVLPSNFTQNLTFADRTTIGTGQNKAFIVHQTQSTECRDCQNSSALVTPEVTISGTLVSRTVDAPNHFLFKNFSNSSENITLNYTKCSGTTNGIQIGSPSVSGPTSTVTIQKQTSSLSKVELDCQNTTIGTCNGSTRQVFLKLKGGSGVYEINFNGKQVDISDPLDPLVTNSELIDEYVLLRNDGLFGISSIDLPIGMNTIKVRDAQIYDLITGANGPTGGAGEKIEQTLRGVKNLSQNGDIQAGGYYSVNIDVPACNVNTIQCTTPPLSYCYRLNVANYASSAPPDLRPITLSGNILNLNSGGDNTRNSIWKILPDGTNSKIVSATNENIAVTIEGSTTLNSIVNVASYTGAGNQKWLINQDAYGNYYLRSSLNNSLFIGGASGPYGGGDTDPNTKDLKLKSDLNWGANKWVMQSVACPAPSCSYTLSNNTQTGIVNSTLTLNPLCNGTDCSSISYSWSGNGQSGSGLNVTLPATSGTYNYTVTGSKVGCNPSIAIISVTVNQAGTCVPVTSITSGGIYKIQNVGANKFIRPNSNISNKLEISDLDNNNTYSLITDGSGFKMTNIATGKIVEILNGSTSPGGNAILATTNPATLSDHQRFQFEYVSGSFKIKPVSVAAWNWGIVVETYTGSGEGGQIRQYGYSSPVADTEKYNVCQISGGARISAIQETSFEQTSRIHIFPNPVHDILQYTYTSEENTKEMEISIYDMVGKKVKKLIQSKTGNITRGEISVENVSQGSFIITISDGINIDAKRFIKE